MHAAKANTTAEAIHSYLEGLWCSWHLWGLDDLNLSLSLSLSL